MDKFVITGGGGFIGSNLVEALLRRGEQVVALDDFSTGRRTNLEQAEEWSAAGGGRYTLAEGDIRDAAVVRRAMDGADFVLHQAAIPSVQRSVQDPLLTNDVNVRGTLVLLEEARRVGVRRFVYASSSSLYGESETLPKVETMPPVPISPYGLQKLAGETYCLLYNRLYGLHTIAFRYFNVYGPRQDPGSDYSAVVPLFIAAGQAGRRA
ncbi:MAG: NAD-dependent epimerase/dehydratase family protein, partial [Gammaproteobacteria bacterium]